MAPALIALAGVLLSGGLAYAQTAKAPVAQKPIVPAAHKPLALQPGPNSTAAKKPKQPHLPPVNPADFTAKTPTKAEVQSFLKTSWGYDPNRIWEVAAIMKTKAPGVHRVVIFVAEKNHPRVGRVQFFVTPDGHHLIPGGNIISFAANPFQHARQVLLQKANGPWEGGKSRTHELVEFADMECPHCKAAQPTIAKLRKDFPNAHYVFENFPLVQIHPEAFLAADYGDCVAKAGGNSAFFKYVDSVFANQSNLTPKDGQTTVDNAVKAAGLNPAKIAACAKSPAGKAAVEASMKLGNELNVDETPTLYADGRPVPIDRVPYKLLKQIVQYQFSLDHSSPASTAASASK